jgi:DNA-binding NtrC family response regulator
MITAERKLILYVDDEQINLDLFKINFANLYNIEICDSPVDALEIINQRKVNLLISDYKMPEMNGMELIYEVKKRWPDIICIILSGYVVSEVVNDKEFLFRYILKPWRKAELIELINEALEIIK